MGPTAPITRADRSVVIFGRLVTIGLAGLLGVGLLWLGVQGFDSAIVELPARGVLDDIGRGTAVGQPRIVAAERTLAGASADDAAILKQRAQFALRRALEGGDDQAGMQRNLELARQWLTDGLAVAPSDAYAWLWLTQAEFLLHGHSPQARAALAVSWRQSPHFAPLALGQVDYGLLLWPSLNTEARERVRAQLAFIATSDPLATAAIARRRGSVAIAHIRQVLATRPGRLAAFERRLAAPAQ